MTVNKQAVRDALLARARAQLDATLAQVASERAASWVDQDSSFSIDDLSQADASGDLTGLFEKTVARQRAAVEAIEALDVSPTSVVKDGAIVGFGGERFVFGVVSEAVECDGVTYEGISEDSPVAAVIAGLGLGSVFSLGGREQPIDFLA